MVSQKIESSSTEQSKNYRNVVSAAARIAVAYAVVGFLWITFSAGIVRFLAPDPATYEFLEEIKGWLFILITAVGLYYLVRRTYQQLQIRDQAMLQQSEAHRIERHNYQTLLNSVEDSIVLIDLDASYLLANNNAAKMIGQTPDYVVGKTVTEILVSERAEFIIDIIKQVAEIKAPIRLQRQYGQAWFDTTYNPVVDLTGKLTGVLAIGRDITEQIRTAEELRQRSEQYRTLLGTISLLAQTLRRDEVLRGVIDRMATVPSDYIEVYLQENTGLRCAATNHTETNHSTGKLMDRERADRILDLLHANMPIVGSTGQGEQCDYCPDTMAKAASWMIVPLTVHEVIIGCLILARVKVQSYNEDEQELATAFARFAAIAISNAILFESLERSESNYRQLINSVDDMVYQGDANLNQIYINAKGREIEQIGYTSSVTRSIIDTIHPDDREATLKAFNEQFAKGDLFQWENRVLGQQGRITYVNHRVRAIRDTQGRLTGIFGIGRDITDYKAAQEALAVRVQQQQIVAQLGQKALLITDLDVLMRETVEIVSKTLGSGYCQILELLLDGEHLLLRAGQGWNEGYIGHKLLKTGTASQAGYTLLTNAPVIANNLNTETRFEKSELVNEYNIVSGITVLIAGHEKPFGVLGIHSTQPKTYTPEDASFMQAVANVLAAAMDRLRTEQALRDSEERNRAIINTAADGIIASDESGVIESFNPAAERLFGYSARDMKGKPLSMLVTPPDQNSREFAGAELVGGEMIGRRKDGSTFALELTKSEMHFAGRRMFTTIVHDITEHVQATQAVARHVRQLSILNQVLQVASAPIGFEKMLNALLTEISDVFNADAADIYLMDPNVGLLYLLAHRGYTITDEEKYSHLSVENSLHGRAIQNGRVVTFTAPLPSGADYPDQLEQLKAIAITPIWTGGNIRGTLAVALWNERPFTEEELALLEGLGRGVGITIENARLYAEAQSYAEMLQLRIEERTQELQKALVHAQSADRTKSALLSTVSHEMRTPLSSIIGFSNLIISRKPEIEKTLEFASAINAEARRLSELINDFLDLQRIESGREVFHYADMDLNELIHDVIRKQQIEDDELHSIELDLEPVPLLYADGNRLRQVILNLLSNALKYSPNGGRIRIQLYRQNDEVIFSIQDDGLGISQEDMKRIFDHFYRSEVAERHRIRGTGLGLGLCREIIHIHNGRIWAESAGLNQGATFSFALPILRSKQKRIVGFQEPNPEFPLIVMVEDDITFSSYLSERLKDENFNSQVLPFKAATSQHIAELKPSLVLLDIIQGQERPGWGILSDLKQNPETCAIPVIVCSILNVPDQAKQAGASSYVEKPVDEDYLINEVRRLTQDNTNN